MALRDSQRRSKRYRDQSLHYLENALSLLSRGEAEKASELLWGSAAQAVKAVAAHKGIELRSHQALLRYVRELSRELGDEAIYRVFHEAESLHSNFYEGKLETVDVWALAQSVRPLVSHLLSMVS